MVSRLSQIENILLKRQFNNLKNNQLFLFIVFTEYLWICIVFYAGKG